MGPNSKKWKGIHHVILATPPLMAMDIEQSIASAFPGQEVNLDSFEDYNQAINFVKTLRTQPFFLIHETGLPAGADQVLRNLASSANSSTFPARAMLIRSGSETISGLKAMAKDSRFIAYEDDIKLRDTNTLAPIFHTLWSAYVDSISAEICSPETRLMLESVALKSTSIGELSFAERLVDLLGPHLSLNWFDYIAAKLSPLATSASNVCPEIIDNNSWLGQIVRPLLFSKILNETSIETIIRSEASLVQRLVQVVNELTRLKLSGTLDSRLSEISANARPGQPAFLRLIARNRNNIVLLANNIDSRESLKVG